MTGKKCVRTGGVDGPDVSGHPEHSAHLPAAAQTPGWEIQDKLMCHRDRTGDRSLSAPGQHRREHADPARFDHLKKAQQAPGGLDSCHPLHYSRESWKDWLNTSCLGACRLGGLLTHTHPRENVCRSATGTTLGSVWLSNPRLSFPGSSHIGMSLAQWHIPAELLPSPFSAQAAECWLDKNHA